MKTTIKKRAFVSAIAMLIVSAIVLTSSTFAWFSMSKEASVESMDLTVSSPEGIQISANASTWTALLSVDDIFDTDPSENGRYAAYAGNNNLYPADLIPVSSAFASADSSTGYANFYKATLDDKSVATVSAVTQVKEAEDAAGIVAFDLFFKVANQTTVYFGETTFDTTSEIKSALRMAFSPLGNGPVTTDTATATAWNTFASASTVCYEVDTLTRSTDAKNAGKTDGEKTTYYLFGTSATGQRAVDGIIDGYGRNMSGTLVKSTADATDKSFTLNPGITKMRVYIWVEGQDDDCLNSVAGAALSAALKFTID